MRGKELYPLGAAIVLAALQAYLGWDGNYHKPALEYSGVDLMYLQKMALCLFFMVWLYRFEGTEAGPVISVLASTSFAIFFIHPFINEIVRKLDIGLAEMDSWLVYLLFVVAALAFCVWVSTAAKRIFRANSRYLIGY
jgi:surface polysaccharide O-acyltransferase-like enzyme